MTRRRGLQRDLHIGLSTLTLVRSTDAAIGLLHTDQSGSCQVYLLALAQLLTPVLTAEDELSSAVVTILAREREQRPRPDPAEISPIDVRAELGNRAAAMITDTPYPPRTRGDTITMIQQLRQRPQSPYDSPGDSQLWGL